MATNPNSPISNSKSGNTFNHLDTESTYTESDEIIPIDSSSTFTRSEVPIGPTQVDTKYLRELIRSANKIAGDIEQTKKELSEQKDASKKELDQLRSDLRTAKSDVDYLKQNRTDALQTLALFVGLFTFVSIQFQLFSAAEKNHILPLSLIFTGSLIFFLAFLAIFIKNANKHLISLLVSGVLITTVGVALYMNTESKDTQTNNACNEINQIISQSSKNDQAKTTDDLKTSFKTHFCSE
jgi:hypothetical protein